MTHTPSRTDRSPAGDTSSVDWSQLQSSRHASSGKRLVISATNKGGVGKSFLMVNLAEWLEVRKQNFIAFDPDWCNSSLTRFYPSARFLSTENHSEIDLLFRAFGETDLVISDGIASLQGKFLDWLIDSKVLEPMDGIEFRVTVVLIVEEDKETVFQAGEAAKALGDRCDYIVARNLKMSPVTEIYNSSKARRTLESLGAREIILERLPWNLLSLMQSSSRSLQHLAAAEDIFILEKQRIRSYLEKLYGQFDACRDILLPPQASGAIASEQPIPPRAGTPRIPPAEV